MSFDIHEGKKIGRTIKLKDQETGQIVYLSRKERRIAERLHAKGKL